LSFNYALWKIGSDGFKYLETNLVRGAYFKWYSSHNRKRVTFSSEKKKSISIPASSNLSVAKKNHDKKTIVVSNRTKRYTPIQTTRKPEKRVTVSARRYDIPTNIAAQQISSAFGIPLHGSKSSYKPIKVEATRNTVKFKPTVRNNWKKFETGETPKQIKIKSKPIVKSNVQKNKTSETPKPVVRVNPIVFKKPTELVMSGLGSKYVPSAKPIKAPKPVEKPKPVAIKTTQVQNKKNKPVNVIVQKNENVVEIKKPQVILKQGTRVLLRRVDNISEKKMERVNKRNSSSRSSFFR
jgi:hypothetical protein